MAKIGKVGAPKQMPNYPGARGTPTVDGDLIYALSSDGDLACLEAKSGNIRWQVTCTGRPWSVHYR